MSSTIIESISVVIIEDDAESATLYEQQLRGHADVQVANTGAEGIRLIDESVDVVLLDRDLPDMPGDEVLSEIRERGFDLAVAMVTGVEPGDDILDLPFDEYLRKPFDRDTLLKTVRVLANRSAFEDKSREFFRLASKKASLNARADDSEALSALIRQMSDLQDELDETIDYLYPGEPVRDHSELDQEEVHMLLAEIAEHTLPSGIRELIDDYQDLEGARPPFMWKWVHRLAPKNTLPCVATEYTDAVPAHKTLVILFITLLDDTLERHHDRATFTELAKIPFAGETTAPLGENVNTEYVGFARRVWETLRSRIEGAPNFDTYIDLLRYDLRQAINAIEYSDLVIQRPDLATRSDLDRYEAHNMVMFAYADIDLMHSPLEVREDLSPLREAIWTAQKMARIGNWVSTWERELREGDYSSGIVVQALEEGLITRVELRQASEDERILDGLIERIDRNGFETEFLAQWEQEYHRLQGYNARLETMDLTPFVEGTEEVLRYHLASTGLK